jgi:hypothetical protein
MDEMFLDTKRKVIRWDISDIVDLDEMFKEMEELD